MKHKHSNRILSRPAHHRRALLRGLVSQLLQYGSIVTTEAKGKELRRVFEPLVTRARGELTLHRRRLLLSVLGSQADLPALQKVAQANAGRPGGYTRVTKLPRTRSDAAEMARVDIISTSQAK